MLKPVSDKASVRKGIVKNAEVKTDKKESGGPKDPEPTRYGDWERKGKCVDF